MSERHETGLVNQYISKVRALAVKGELGEDVGNGLQEIVDAAHEHFTIIQGSTTEANLKAFRGQLKVAAVTAPENQPAYRKTLEDAASLVDQIISSSP